jgi:hypothetical protein
MIVEAKLGDFLESLGVQEDVKSFIEGLPNDAKPFYVNVLKKNPSISVAELQAAQPPQKQDPYLPAERQYASAYFQDERMERWYLVNMRKLRRGILDTQVLPEEYWDVSNLLNDKLQEVLDWYRMTSPDIEHMDISQTIRASDEWHQLVAGQGEGTEYYPTNPNNIVYGPQWGDDEKWNGWTIQQITTENDLSAEGNKMNHCVGSYWSDVESGNVLIFSLRDHQNEPHVTMETNADLREFQQIQGNSNQDPKDEYKKMIAEWIRSLPGEHYLNEVGENSPYETFYNGYSDVDDMIKSLEMMLTANEYGLIEHQDGSDINLEDLMQTLIQTQEKQSGQWSRDSDYHGSDITESPSAFVRLAIRIGEHEDQEAYGLFQLEKAAYQILQENEEEFYKNWWWEYWESPPDEDEFETPEEYDAAMEKYYEESNEAESEAVDEAMRYWTRYALPRDTIKILHDMREEGKYPSWESLVKLYEKEKAA